MLADDLRQMRSDDGRGIYYRVAQALRPLSLTFRDPDSRQMEGRLERGDTRNLLFHITGIHCHIMVKQDFSLTDLNTFDLDDILIRIQLNIITQTDNRHHRTKFQRNLSSDHNHAIQQVTALVHIRQRNNTVTKFQLDGIHLQQTVDIFRLPDLLRRSFLAVYLLFDLCRLDRALDISCHDDKHQSQSHEQDRVQFCHESQDCQHGSHQVQTLGYTEQLAYQCRTEVSILASLGHQNTGGQ